MSIFRTGSVLDVPFLSASYVGNLDIIVDYLTSIINFIR
jgi:hypothetical protein